LNCLKRLVRRPLLIAVLLLVIVLLAFGGVLLGVITAGSILVIDTSVDRLLASHRQPIATELFLCFTFLGKGPEIAASALAAGALFLVLGRRNYVVPLALTLGGAEGSVQLLKRAVGRVRPNPDLAYYVERSFSFPSAHATLAAAFYGFLAYAIVQEAQPRRAASGGYMCHAPDGLGHRTEPRLSSSPLTKSGLADSLWPRHCGDEHGAGSAG
jgi:membrane-associated phospholipid phosphatase